MPAESQAQRGFLATNFGVPWMRRHHFDNKGPLPQYVHHALGTANVGLGLYQKKMAMLGKQKSRAREPK